MGLDTVELVMQVEKHFGIDIPDSEASELVTVGMLHSWVVAELNRVGRPQVDPQGVFVELRELICNQLGVEHSKVVPEARFVQGLTRGLGQSIIRGRYYGGWVGNR